MIFRTPGLCLGFFLGAFNRIPLFTDGVDGFNGMPKVRDDDASADDQGDI